MNKNDVINEILRTAYKAVPKKYSLDGSKLIEIHNEIGSILDKYALGAVSNNEVSVCEKCGNKYIPHLTKPLSICDKCADAIFTN